TLKNAGIESFILNTSNKPPIERIQSVTETNLHLPPQKQHNKRLYYDALQSSGIDELILISG
ncbi:hypothetical protein AB4453_11605, partial [Vibrio atlanticus]|uniref:hypothetical protein n=1 Tax=Vibrio atlanticus TaxID=693153 RepID=UPI0035501ADE